MPLSPTHRVWVVDDSPVEAALAARVLSPEFHVEIFSDGASLLEAVAAARELPDAIVADWVLPGLDGIEVCRSLRETYDELALPVMIVTSRTGPEAVLDALDAGVNDLVEKPFQPRELRARVRVLTRIRRLHQRATELEAAVGMFVGTVSHDLRTPLHAISGYASLMLGRDDLPEKHRHWVNRISTVSGRMGRMLDELIELTELRGGTGITLARSVTRLNDIVTMVVEELQAARGVTIATTFEGDNEGLWDADRLARVVENLASNAIVHGLDGAQVRIEVLERADHTLLLVHNHGRPVPESLRDSLFDPFRRRQDSRKGLGLGLYITRELVKAHGGEITFTSSAAEGTTFTVRLPRASAPAAASDPRPLA